MDVKKLIARMTLEEKASLCSGFDFWHTKPVERLGVPSVMVSDGPHGLRKQAQEGDHLGINDSIRAVCFPAACATAASFDRDVTRQIGEAMGDACQHERVSVVLGPAVNIKRSPLCGRNFEYFSEDPCLAGEMAAALAQGVQSRNIGVSVKHFAANNQETRRMSSDSVVDERTMREIYLPAFENVVRHVRPWTVLCSYNRINGVYACENPEYLTKILREEWGFDGYVMSDWGAVDDRVLSLKAGLDLEMPSSGGVNDKRLVAAVRSGELDEKTLDQAVERILTVTDRYLKSEKRDTPWDMEAQHRLARKLAAECMVLLKNDGVLPLKENARAAIIGLFVEKPRYQGGGSSHINSFRVTSLMDALEGNGNITYAQGYGVENEEPDEELIAQAVRAAKDAETAVIVCGLPDSFESEGYDRTHLRMPRCQTELISRVAEANPNTVVVLYNGSPVEMPWLGQVKGVIEAYLGGQAVGGATADVLYGRVNPCGRLPETYPLRLEHNPSYLTFGGEKDKVVYSEGVFVGYRYYDKKNLDVLFPFGFGLSYTAFEYKDLTLGASSIRDTDALSVSVTVKNVGPRAGKEVVQLYVSDRESTVFRPVRELKAFEKVFLEPGMSKTVTFSLDKRAFAYWNEEIHDWHVETGAFAVQIGRSSRDIALSKEVFVTGTTPLPAHYTMNTIFADLMETPKAMAVIGPLLQQMGGAFGGGGDDRSETAAGAVSDDMLKAMLGAAPLRALLSFTASAVGYEQLEALVYRLNHLD